MTETTRGRTSLGHFPAGAWEFDASVVAAFDDMVSRSVPLYDDLHRFAVELARPIVVADSLVLDVGCSTGRLVRRLRAELDVYVHGVDESEPMVDEARARFRDDERVSIVRADLTRPLDGFAELDALRGPRRYDAAFAILTLMFLPPVSRLRVLAELHARTSPGGVLVVAEKTYARDARNEQVFTAAYHAFKRRAGYSAEEVEAKARSLEGVLRPWTVDQTTDVLREAGFRDVDLFAKWGPFVGMVARR